MNTGVISANLLQSRIRNYKQLKLSSKYQTILGSLPANSQWTLLIHGIAGSGKSTYSLQIANELSRFSPVLYGNFEESVGATLSAKLKLTKIRSYKIHFLENNTESEFWKMLDSGEYKYVVVDSLSHITNDLKVRDFWDKIVSYPSISFILISHALKSRDGKSETNYRGASTLGHIVDINQRVVNGVVWNEKNRLLGKDCNNSDGYDIFRKQRVSFSKRK